MNTATHNVDADEIEKFEKLASRWWDPHSEFKTLHDINPLRLDYIDRLAPLTGRHVIDIGCGGGLLSEGMVKRGADVIGIDMGKAPLTIARLHQHESGLEIDYRQMEMLEHVPDPAKVIAACAQLIKDDGYIFLSTINRNPKAYLFAVIGAEYLLRLLPTGTHDYSKFIRPSEMEGWARASGLQLVDLTGMSYNPLTQEYKLGKDVSVNYLACFRKA